MCVRARNEPSRQLRLTAKNHRPAAAAESAALLLLILPLPQVIEETHGFYNKLRSGARANTEELSLV